MDFLPKILSCCFLIQIFALLLPFAFATIAGGYELQAGAPGAEPSAPSCGNLDETSETKANGHNPFCVYPALIGSHPSPGRRPGGATNPTEFSGTSFDEDHGAGESPAGGFQGTFEAGVGPFKPAGRRKRRMAVRRIYF